MMFVRYTTCVGPFLKDLINPVTFFLDPIWVIMHISMRTTIFSDTHYNIDVFFPLKILVECNSSQYQRFTSTL